MQTWGSDMKGSNVRCRGHTGIYGHALQRACEGQDACRAQSKCHLTATKHLVYETGALLHTWNNTRPCRGQPSSTTSSYDKLALVMLHSSCMSAGRGRPSTTRHALAPHSCGRRPQASGRPCALGAAEAVSGVREVVADRLRPAHARREQTRCELKSWLHERMHEEPWSSAAAGSAGNLAPN